MTSENSTKKIMLVEDNKGDAILAREALTFNKSDTTLIHVFNGDEVFEYLNKVENQRPDLVLLDLNLPGMNGLEILQILKKDPESEKIPVIVFSTSNSETDIKKCMESRADDYITKPLDLVEFFDVFKKLDKFIKKNTSPRG